MRYQIHEVSQSQRHPASSDLVAGTLWHRRPGSGCISLCRLSKRKRPESLAGSATGTDGLWRFAIDWNFDLLTRIELELETGRTQHLRVRLYRNDRDSAPVWSSAADIPLASETGRRTLQFVPTPPLRQFRSGLIDPFVIRVDGGLSIYRVTAHGVVVDMQGYRIVHRNGTCFTAVEERQTNRWTPLIRELQSSHD